MHRKMPVHARSRGVGRWVAVAVSLCLTSSIAVGLASAETKPACMFGICEDGSEADPSQCKLSDMSGTWSCQGKVCRSNTDKSYLSRNPSGGFTWIDGAGRVNSIAKDGAIITIGKGFTGTVQPGCAKIHFKGDHYATRDE